MVFVCLVFYKKKKKTVPRINYLHLRRKRLCPFVALGTASADMFRFLSWVFVACLVSVFYSKCVLRIFDVIHQKNKTPPCKSWPRLHGIKRGKVWRMKSVGNHPVGAGLASEPASTLVRGKQQWVLGKRRKRAVTSWSLVLRHFTVYLKEALENR